MTDEELNKRLHEIMGLCWHEKVQDCIVSNNRVVQGEKCSCGHSVFWTMPDFHYNANIDFLTWEGFGILWKFIQEHPRRGEMLKKWEREDDSGTMYIEEWIIDPSSLAEIVVEFFEADI